MSILDSIFNKLSKYINIKDDISKAPEVQKELVEPCQLLEAKKYHGMHERTHNKVLRSLLGFDPAKTPWCAGFVNSIERLCGRKGIDTLLARHYLKYGVPISNPLPGDIAVFKRGNSSWQGHVAYFISKDNKGILVLGGNQSNKVCYKYYPASSLLGYRRPK